MDIFPPKIIYGTAWKKTDTSRLVIAAIQQGFRGIDTACQPKHYDEGAVGTGVAACLNNSLGREDLYLQSKFTPISGHDPAKIPYDPTAPLADQVTQSCGASLRHLQTTYLDCLLLHSPLATAKQTLQVWRAMESLVAHGRVRRLGISNCYQIEQLEALFDAAHIKPSVLQNRLYADTGYDRVLRAFCNRQLISYQSFWTLTANPQILAAATIVRLAAHYERTPVQLFFRYLTQRQVVPLTGTRSQIHMREDLAIFEFELSSAELEAIDILL